MSKAKLQKLKKLNPTEPEANPTTFEFTAITQALW
jgi:hypothetical protein